MGKRNVQYGGQEKVLKPASRRRALSPRREKERKNSPHPLDSSTGKYLLQYGMGVLDTGNSEELYRAQGIRQASAPEGEGLQLLLMRNRTRGNHAFPPTVFLDPGNKTNLRPGWGSRGSEAAQLRGFYFNFPEEEGTSKKKPPWINAGSPGLSPAHS